LFHHSNKGKQPMKKRTLFTLLLGLIISFTSIGFASGVATESGVADGIPVYAIKQAKAIPVINSFIASAEKDLYVRETRTNSSPQIDQYLKYVGLNPGYAWCMAYTQFHFNRGCMSNAVPNSLIKGASVRTVYRQMRMKGTRLPSNRAGERGQLMCFRHGTTQYGHVAIVTGRTGSGKLTTVEGNTGPDGGRDGDGVYRKVRPLQGYAKLRTEGFIAFV
jgi:hypothetical protein